MLNVMWNRMKLPLCGQDQYHYIAQSILSISFGVKLCHC